jgi:peptidylprolyl isomerase
MQTRPRSLFAATALTVSLALTGVACGSDDEADSTTSTTAADSGSDAAAAVEERGEPTVEAVAVPVAELEVIDDVVGTGATAEPSSTVEAQYVGIVAETGEVFQSSWQMDGAIAFPLDGVIQGWSEGLVGMKEGGRRTLVIPAAMAYGPNPPPGSGIPANADLVFTVDLVSVS